jgi:opacity protein-like surface antigen
MMKTVASITAFGLVMGVSAVAAAQQNPNCPPGSWFCADAQVPGLGGAQITIGGGTQTQLQPLPPPQQQIQVQPPPVVIQQQPLPQQPPVVVYQPAPPPVYIMRPPQPDYRTYYVRRPVLMPHSEWGLNLHLEGAYIGSGYNNSAGLGGFGAGLRYKPTPWFGVEAGADFAIGRDYNDYARNETAFTLNAMLFLNPRSRAQVYLLGGFGWSIANVNNDTGNAFGSLANCGPSGNCSDSYHYFGGQAGVGIEYRLSRNLAVNLDLRGFLRGRTDSGAANNPEFVDPGTGKTTNTSGGMLVTGGMTFYF